MPLKWLKLNRFQLKAHNTGNYKPITHSGIHDQFTYADFYIK